MKAFNLTLEQEVRALGYQLAVREIYGDNSPPYHKLRSQHYKLLRKLYNRDKKS